MSRNTRAGIARPAQSLRSVRPGPARSITWLSTICRRASAISIPTAIYGPIAQLDRAPDYESGGSGFESSWDRHHLRVAQSGRVRASDARGRRIEACHADQIEGLSSIGRVAGSDPAYGGSIPSAPAKYDEVVEYGLGSGLQSRPCGFESRPHLHAFVCQLERLRSSKPAIDVRVIARAPIVLRVHGEQEEQKQRCKEFYSWNARWHREQSLAQIDHVYARSKGRHGYLPSMPMQNRDCDRTLDRAYRLMANGS